MRWLFSICGLWLSVGPAVGEMVPNSSIGNDPEREKLCMERTSAHFHSNAVRFLPFEINKEFVGRFRPPNYRGGPVVFVVAKMPGAPPELVECTVLSNGKYGPITFSVQGSNGGRWRLMDEPNHSLFASQAGASIAQKSCFDAVMLKLKHPGYDHIGSYPPAEVNPAEAKGRVRYFAGMVIGGVRAKQYDVVVPNGTVVYKSSHPDMDTVDFTCLLSPMLEVKAIQLK